MRAAWMFLIAGCGRVGFDPRAVDGGGADAAVDAVEALPGLRARYAMDDVPTDGVDDATGLHPGSCRSTCPQQAPGHAGTGYLFDGVDNLIVVPFAPDLAPAGLTVAASVLLTAAPTTRACVASMKLGDQTSDTWAVCIEPNLSVLYFSSTTAVPSTNLFSPVGAITIGGWHHVAITYDGTHKRIFVDATELAAQPATQEYDQHDLLIGGNIDNTNLIAMFPATMDDLQIYDRALTAAELAVLATP